MGVRVSSRNEEDYRSFRLWSEGVVGLSISESFDGPWCMDRVLRSWRCSEVQSRWVVSWYRGMGCSVPIEPVVGAVLWRCMGHRLNRGLVLGFPRVAALCARLFWYGRWREAEGCLGGDPVACYLYALVLEDRLPDHLHNRMVLEHGSGMGWVVGRYLSEFC